ncbi:hypothetical protein [Nonomuraea candida]|uniref:hypothetical protein n=1 Tax=Nonomuraea candida TaxID=359159 RepID=UPI0005BD5848|nr:hypothetical protein [Nonomuraea candida]
MNGQESVSVECVPVLTRDEERLLDAVLAAPFSYVSTDGPVWRTAAMRQRIVQDERRSHLVVRRSGVLIGAVSWSMMQTPGVARLAVTSNDDESWSSAVAAQAIRGAVGILCRTHEVVRVELLVATYNQVLLEYLVEYDSFIIEGVLRDRFFIDGKFWPAVICRANLEKFSDRDRHVLERRGDVIRALRKKTLEDLTQGNDHVSWTA